MIHVSAHAVRKDKIIEVTISGSLYDSCYQARVEDTYPGGTRTYVADPGAAQVFIEEATKPGSRYCPYMLMPWGVTVSIPDTYHNKVEIFVNNDQILEVPLVESTSEFIVVALTGTNTGCSIIPKDALCPAIYSKVFGPASHDDCEAWVAANCAT